MLWFGTMNALLKCIGFFFFFLTVKGKDGLNQDLCSSLILPDKNSEL